MCQLPFKDYFRDPAQNKAFLMVLSSPSLQPFGSNLAPKGPKWLPSLSWLQKSRNWLRQAQMAPKASILSTKNELGFKKPMMASKASTVIKSGPKSTEWTQKYQLTPNSQNWLQKAQNGFEKPKMAPKASIRSGPRLLASKTPNWPQQLHLAKRP